MRIVYFSRSWSPHDYRFLAALAETEHKVFYLRWGNDRISDDRLVPAAVESVRWAGQERPFRWQDLPRLLPDFRRALRRLQPDLLHAGPIQDAGLLATLSGFRPRLIMSWGFDLMEDVDRSAWMQRVTGFVLSRADFFVSDAEVTRQRALTFGLPAGRTRVFPWGVDLAHFTPRSWPPVDEAAPVTLFCNRSWYPRYGVDVLARAFVRAAREDARLHLMLLGNGPQAGKIRQILQAGGVLERVTFPGYIAQAELPRYYHMADVYISPSHVDGSSVSLMEALACGLPALVSDIPANREWVREGENGWLFSDGDVAALTDKIKQAVAQRADWAQLGANARIVAENRADWRKNFQVLLAAYQQAVEV